MAVAPFRSACFFSTDNGATVQRRASAQEEQNIPLPGSGVTNLFRFDEKQPNNTALSAQWASNSLLFTMTGSTVFVNEQEAGFDPPGLLFRALQNAATLFVKLESTPDALSREEQAQLGAIAFSAKGLLV